MKKVLGLMVGMFLTLATFANGVVTYSDANTAEKSKSEGVFHFSFDSEFTQDQIDKAAKYYTSYFTVTPTVTTEGFNVAIKLVEDNEMSRRVITRFFVTLDVNAVNVNGTPIKIDDFIAKYVMN